MAENVTIAGATYPEVDSITMPTSDGGEAVFVDVNAFLKTFLDQSFELNHPVGSLFMTNDSRNPNEIFDGRGTWEQIKDRFLLSAGSTYSAGSTGGEAEHTLTVDEMPKHTHAQLGANGDEPNTSPVRQTFQSDGHVVVYDSTGKPIWYNNVMSDAEKIYRATTINEDGETGETGNSQPHNNMPPYLAVYMWKRTA